MPGKNPTLSWNGFLQANKGQGLTIQELSALYQYEKSQKSQKSQSGGGSNQVSFNNTSFRVGDRLVPMTVTDVRKNLWNPKKKEWKSIDYVSPQSHANRLIVTETGRSKDKGDPYIVTREEYDDPESQREMEEKYPNQMIHRFYRMNRFKPTGNLIELSGWSPCDIPPGKFSCSMTMENKRIHKNWLQSKSKGPYSKGQIMPFYYLGAACEDNGEDETRFQVCSRPKNMLSLDCLDSITMFVPEHKLK